MLANAALRSARDEAATAQAQAQRLYRAGRSPCLTGLDAERTSVGAEAALAASDAQLALDVVDLSWPSAAAGSCRSARCAARP